MLFKPTFHLKNVLSINKDLLVEFGLTADNIVKTARALVSK